VATYVTKGELADVRKAIRREISASEERVMSFIGSLGGNGGGAVAPSLMLIHDDAMAEASPVSEWGAIQAASLARYELINDGGGDQRPRGDGTAQISAAYRRLNLVSGDEFLGTERTELGANDCRYGEAGGSGTFALYKTGQRRTTFVSMRLPESFPLSNANWQVVTQMKQTQPYSSDTAGGVILELEARENEFQIITPTNPESSPLFKFAAAKNVWVRFRWDVFYSSDNTVARVRLRADTRGNKTTFEPNIDSGELAPTKGTLSTANGEQTNGSPSVHYANGEAIPSHLRAGIYRNPVIATTTYIDIDNVQVYSS
jgi:hypothetical protein